MTTRGPRWHGRAGYVALVEKYGERQVKAWRRLGGRRPNPTLAQIEAGIEPKRARVKPKREVRIEQP
ncbi:MAG: hypothetical protein AB7I13_05930 [Vicinamibacterales bacterium]